MAFGEKVLFFCNNSQVACSILKQFFFPFQYLKEAHTFAKAIAES